MCSRPAESDSRVPQLQVKEEEGLSLKHVPFCLSSAYKSLRRSLGGFNFCDSRLPSRLCFCHVLGRNASLSPQCALKMRQHSRLLLSKSQWPSLKPRPEKASVIPGQDTILLCSCLTSALCSTCDTKWAVWPCMRAQCGMKIQVWEESTGAGGEHRCGRRTQVTVPFSYTFSGIFILNTFF